MASHLLHFADQETIWGSNFDVDLDDLKPSSLDSSLSQFLPSLQERRHQCHLCHQEFASVEIYRVHLKQHGRQTLFRCSICSKSFDNISYVSTSQLWRHISRIHLKSKHSFTCTVCDKVFKQAFNYHLHMLIHLGEQPERCRFCTKSFRTKPSLRKHELIHTGEKPHVCDMCQASFKTKDELKQHGISHRTDKPFQCRHCHIQFKYQASMKRHEKKGRCVIGKHWCPVKKRVGKNTRTKSTESCSGSSSLGDDEDTTWFDEETSSKNTKENDVMDLLRPDATDYKDVLLSKQQPLFCDVFVGWGNNCMGNNNSSSTTSSGPPKEPLFSF